MIWIIVLLILSLVLVAVAFVFYTGLPDSRTVPGKRVKVLLMGTGVSLLVCLGLGASILMQEQTGVGMVSGLSGGVESDARQWVSLHSASPPKADQAGDNIQILREGLEFLNRHPSVGGTPEGQAISQRYGTLPARPTRLLTRAEENQYYEGAQAVYRLIRSVAGQGAGTVSE